MIPKSGGKYAPWLELTPNMVVKVLTEAGPKDNPKLKSPFYCDVEYKGNTYSLSLNWASYYNISKVFGPDTDAWMGQYIKYAGKLPIKTKIGTVTGHVWVPIEEAINLEQT